MILCSLVILVAPQMAAQDAQPFLGQSPPGTEPVLFAPGIVSTDTREWSMAATPNGTEIFFGLSSLAATAILHTAIVDGRWTSLEVAEFSGEFDDFDLTMAPDGNRVYFTSDRPQKPGGEVPQYVDIWYVDRTPDGWGQPVRLPEPISSPHRELYPSQSKNGEVIFFSNRPGGYGGSDLYSAALKSDGFGPPRNLGPNVNTEAGESDACISPSGDFVVFTSSRDGGFGRGDLYITFKEDDGTWGPAENLGPAINTEYTEFCPSISGDGRYLFFTSNRPRNHAITNHDGGLRDRLGATLEGVPSDIDIYWVDAALLRRSR